MFDDLDAVLAVGEAEVDAARAAGFEEGLKHGAATVAREGAASGLRHGATAGFRALFWPEFARVAAGAAAAERVCLEQQQQQEQLQSQEGLEKRNVEAGGRAPSSRSERRREAAVAALLRECDRLPAVGDVAPDDEALEDTLVTIEATVKRLVAPTSSRSEAAAAHGPVLSPAGSHPDVSW
jgi:hypothetical protein